MPKIADPMSRVLRLASGGPRARGTKNHTKPIVVPNKNIHTNGWASGQALNLR
jgi:hypothetical protein